MLEMNRDYRLRLKTEVLTHYGPKGKLQCSWAGCKIKDLDMLTLDHVNNDGKQHRSLLHRGGTSGGPKTLVDVRRRGYPEGFQTLCGGHQLKKEIELRRKNRAR